jgi:hypothetical protein
MQHWPPQSTAPAPKKLSEIAQESFNKTNPGILACEKFMNAIAAELELINKQAPSVGVYANSAHKSDSKYFAPTLMSLFSINGPEIDYDRNSVSLEITLRTKDTFDAASNNGKLNLKVTLSPADRVGNAFKYEVSSCRCRPVGLSVNENYGRGESVSQIEARNAIMEGVFDFVAKRAGKDYHARLMLSLMNASNSPAFTPV